MLSFIQLKKQQKEALSVIAATCRLLRAKGLTDKKQIGPVYMFCYAFLFDGIKGAKQVNNIIVLIEINKVGPR